MDNKSGKSKENKKIDIKLFLFYYKYSNEEIIMYLKK